MLFLFVTVLTQGLRLQKRVRVELLVVKRESWGGATLSPAYCIQPQV